MHLKSLGMKNFKNLNIDALELSALNIFVGPNGSGKTNLVNALRFLQTAAGSEGQNGLSGFEKALSLVNGDSLLDKTCDRPDTVTLEYSFSSDEQRLGLTLDLLVLEDNQGVRVNREMLITHNGKDPHILYLLHDRGPGLGMISVLEGDNKSTHHESLSDLPANSLGLSTLPRILEGSTFSLEQIPAISPRRKLIDTLADWRFYNANHMDLSGIREATPKIGLSDRHVATDGTNLALVMHNLIQDSIEFEEMINLAIRSALPSSRRIRPRLAGRLGLTLEWHTEGAKYPFFLDEMSDGTVRLIILATILMSPKLPSLLVLDEPEMGLHVAWLPLVAEWIKQAAERTQVILITHSPDLLDAFTDELECVVRFHTNRQGAVSLKPLRRSEIEHRLADEWQLGDLYRAGDPDFGAWPW